MKKIKIASLIILSLTLTSCFSGYKEQKSIEKKENKTGNIETQEENRYTYDMEEYQEFRKAGHIMVHGQKIEITDKTPDQTIAYYASYALQGKGEGEEVSKEEYQKKYKEFTKQRTVDEIVKDKNLSFSEIDMIVLNSGKESMKYDNPKIREHYYIRFKDFENGLKDKDQEVVKKVKEYKERIEKRK